MNRMDFDCSHNQQKLKKVLIQMNCSQCHNNFNIIQRLPVIDHAGNTICSQCITSDTTHNVVYNKQLIKLMGYCPQHITTPLSLFCIDDKKYVCEKCVIYGKSSQQSISKTFIENSKIKQAISEKTKEMQILLSQIHSSQSQIEKVFQKTQNSCFQTIQAEYLSALELINKKRDEGYEKIISSMKSFREELVSEYLQQFQILNCKIIGSKQKKEEKKLLNKIQNIKGLEKISHDLSLQLEILSAHLIKFQQSFNFKLTFIQKDQQNEDLSFNLSLSQGNDFTIDQISLLEPENDNKWANQSVSWIKFEEETETASNMSYMSLPLIEKTKKDTGKDILILKNSCGTKIGSNIKQIKGQNMLMTNLQAKKLLENVKKSFTECLDISGNKITSLFIRDLSKVQIGKYLKTIDLRGNQINEKDVGIKKKIDALHKQGVQIII